MIFRKIMPLAAMLGMVILSITTIVTARADIAKAAGIDIPDANLEAVIRESINNPSGDILKSELEGIVTLDGSNSDIASLAGLEYCINLTSLDLCFNQISDISPVSGLTNLTELRISSNPVSDISSLSGLKNLKELWLVNMLVSDISTLSSLTDLKYLYLSYNQISDISPLSGLTNLLSLDLSVNKISNASYLAGLSNLTELWLGYNQIIDISPVSELDGLIKLRIGNNKISDISTLSKLTNLTILTLSNNLISGLSPLSGLTKLTSLRLEGNQVINISPVSDLTELMYLNLNNNTIDDISPVAGLSNLKSLDLGTNNITDITYVAYLTILSSLKLDNNQISDISSLSGLKYLQYVDLNSNSITDIKPLVSNAEIATGDTIDVRYNQLSTTSLNTYVDQLKERGADISYTIPPYADFTATIVTEKNPITVKFTNNSVSTDGIKSCLWDFGDDQTGTDYNPTHKYDKEGIYTVSLTITESDGDIYTASKTDYFTLNKIVALQTVSSENPTTVKSDNERITLEFPEYCVASDAVVGISEELDIDSIDCPAGFKSGATCFNIDTNKDLEPGTKVTIVINYCDEDIEACGGDLNQLKLSHYDDDTNQWSVLPTVVDTETMTLESSTRVFSKFMVMAGESTSELGTSKASDNVFSIGLMIIAIAAGLIVTFGIVKFFNRAK